MPMAPCALCNGIKGWEAWEEEKTRQTSFGEDKEKKALSEEKRKAREGWQERI